ncbi:hypothetical protein, partial [Tardiphaga sp. P5_C10]
GQGASAGNAPPQGVPVIKAGHASPFHVAFIINTPANGGCLHFHRPCWKRRADLSLGSMRIEDIADPPG